MIEIIGRYGQSLADLIEEKVPISATQLSSVRKDGKWIIHYI
jgi:hypothetical protein